MVELARLESVYRRNPIKGSNPFPSAEIAKYAAIQRILNYRMCRFATLEEQNQRHFQCIALRGYALALKHSSR